MKLALAALVALTLAPLVAPAEASAPFCSSITNPACSATVCVYDRVSGAWRCWFPIDWDCLIRRPCWYPQLGLP